MTEQTYRMHPRGSGGRSGANLPGEGNVLRAFVPVESSKDQPPEPLRDSTHARQDSRNLVMEYPGTTNLRGEKSSFFSRTVRMAATKSSSCLPRTTRPHGAGSSRSA